LRTPCGDRAAMVQAADAGRVGAQGESPDVR
jgi:hypothetical protein